MPNPYFSFKQFTVYHDRCAMKVGTDGVLLGAWTDVSGARDILDIGTGTGLIALMLAQRSEAHIMAVDIDEDAVKQAKENVEKSPWPGRIEVERHDICCFNSDIRYDVIVSNPPYFFNSLKCPDGQRNIARHTVGLDFESLIDSCGRLLSPSGRFSVIIPTDGMDEFMRIASEGGLCLSRRTWIKTKPDAAPKRVSMEFKKQPAVSVESCLVVELSRHIYSEEYIALTKDFYLKM